VTIMTKGNLSRAVFVALCSASLVFCCGNAGLWTLGLGILISDADKVDVEAPILVK